VMRNASAIVDASDAELARVFSCETALSMGLSSTYNVLTCIASWQIWYLRSE
jgi:hypothetical protein